MFIDRNCCRDRTLLRIFGWGATTQGSSFPSYLMTGNMYFMPTKKCKRHEDFADLNPEYICAEGLKEGAAPCRGDIGSPLILDGGAEDVLIGIVGSAGIDHRCRGEKPTPFVKIGSVLGWIQSNV